MINTDEFELLPQEYNEDDFYDPDIKKIIPVLNDVITDYIKIVGKNDILKSNDESELLKAYKNGNIIAKEKLIRCNLRLVVKIARTFQGKSLPLEDLIQEGTIGLIKAIDKFDPSKGNKLSTYATFWIRQAILRAINNKGFMIRLPVHIVEKTYFINKIIKDLEKKLNRIPTIDEVSNTCNISVEKLNKIKEYLNNILSLDFVYSNNDSENKHSLIDFYNNDLMAIDDEVDKYLEYKKIRQCIYKLPPTWQKILISRTGLDGKKKTYREISKELNYSVGWIKTMEGKAINQIKDYYKLNEKIQLKCISINV